jgi:hypothetical protein
VPRGAAVPDGSAIAIEIGPPLIPPAVGNPAYAAVRAWHEEIMMAIARLSGKSWEFGAQEAER